MEGELLSGVRLISPNQELSFASFDLACGAALFVCRQVGGWLLSIHVHTEVTAGIYCQ
jgi:hypothetical protein